ncbi:MAG: cupin domain-containing protein [Flavobacteriales bacterium]
MKPKKIFIPDNGRYPGNSLPVLVYKSALKLPRLFPAKYIKKLFQKNGWTRNWKDGIYTYDHYHSNTHEVLGVSKGKSTIRFGGEKGPEITLEKGDVVVIPAGVAHKNLGRKNDLTCVGGYPEGKYPDSNYGEKGERPKADYKIASLSLPKCDPVFGENKGLVRIWKDITE